MPTLELKCQLPVILNLNKVACAIELTAVGAYALDDFELFRGDSILPGFHFGDFSSGFRSGFSDVSSASFDRKKARLWLRNRAFLCLRVWD